MDGSKVKPSFWLCWGYLQCNGSWPNPYEIWKSFYLLIDAGVYPKDGISGPATAHGKKMVDIGTWYCCFSLYVAIMPRLLLRR